MGCLQIESCSPKAIAFVKYKVRNVKCERVYEVVNY